MKKTIILIICLLLFPSNGRTESELNYSPLIYRECLPRDIYSELDHNLVDEWIVLTIQAIKRDDDALQRRLFSVVDTDCGAFGVFHLQPRKRPLNINWSGDCAFNDPEWLDNIQSVLYSDYSLQIQLSLWLETVDIVMDHVSNKPEYEQAAWAALANSAPGDVRRWGRNSGWDIRIVLVLYMKNRADSFHRQERVQWIEDNLLNRSN